jgi:hypothetical protein
VKVITKRDVIKQAIINFRSLWGDGSYTTDTRGRPVGAELGALNADKVTAEEVDMVIGRIWTRLECNECGKDVDAVAEVGEEPKCESDTARVCFDCIQRAFSLLDTRIK